MKVGGALLVGLLGVVGACGGKGAGTPTYTCGAVGNEIVCGCGAPQDPNTGIVVEVTECIEGGSEDGTTGTEENGDAGADASGPNDATDEEE